VDALLDALEPLAPMLTERALAERVASGHAIAETC
jgi:hypothetical protein